VSSLRDVAIPPMKNDVVFEELCLDLWRKKYQDSNAQLNGRPGQKQEGVDIFGRICGTSKWFGVQCKVCIKSNLTENDVQIEIQKALQFNPKLSEYIFVTTSSRDEKLQEFARLQTQENLKRDGFSVTILFWDDIELELKKEEYLDIFIRYYRDSFIKSENFGMSIGKLVEISLGVGETTDTRYEFMIGKIPRLEKDVDGHGLNYFKGTYFIVNLNDRKFETFPIPCYPTDIEILFQSKRDTRMICKWLNKIKNIDELIYGKEERHIQMITTEEWQEEWEFLKE